MSSDLKTIQNKNNNKNEKNVYLKQKFHELYIIKFKSQTE